MKWYRYRSMSSSGWSKWHYICLPEWIPTTNKDEMTRFFESQDDVPTWSEHYRRVEWKRVHRLPAKELERQKEMAKTQLESVQRLLGELGMMSPAKVDPNEVEK